MNKKHSMAIGGMLLLAVFCAGCGKKDSDLAVQNDPTPTASAEASPTVTQQLVEMETIEEENVMGEKTSTASKLTIVNQTGDDVKALYIRQTPSDDEEDEDEWGDDLINGSFTLENGDSAVYYYEKSSASGTYDIRITYTEEGKNECFFRMLPLTTITKITLRMNGSGEDGIPYATYMTSGASKEVSTLDEVKKRLGLDSDEDSESTESSESSPTSTPEPQDDPEPTSEPEPTEEPDSSDDTDSSNAMVDAAKSYIGSSLDDLESGIGSGEYSEYDSDEEQGTIGYHYYDNFTVYTTIDDNGDEVVSGVY